jgi:hypothetical protein
VSSRFSIEDLGDLSNDQRNKSETAQFEQPPDSKAKISHMNNRIEVRQRVRLDWSVRKSVELLAISDTEFD